MPPTGGREGGNYRIIRQHQQSTVKSNLYRIIIFQTSCLESQSFFATTETNPTLCPYLHHITVTTIAATKYSTTTHSRYNYKYVAISPVPVLLCDGSFFGGDRMTLMSLWIVEWLFGCWVVWQFVGSVVHKYMVVYSVWWRVRWRVYLFDCRNLRYEGGGLGDLCPNHRFLR